MLRLNFIYPLLFALALPAVPAPARIMELDLQSRDPKTGQIAHHTEQVDSAKIAVVTIDPWNFHWCMTACERVSAMVPRWNRAMQCARELGMQVIWGPSDVIGSYAGWPQRERALAVKYIPVPQPQKGPIQPHFTAPGGGCMCGPGYDCKGNYGWDGMNPGLVIGENDLIISATEELYALLKERGITHVIYTGLHTNICLFGKPGALRFMVDAGLHCMLARDINDAITLYDPKTGFTPDQGTRQVDADLERIGILTINMADEMRKAGAWHDDWVVETVRIAPWGKPQRPYCFDRSILVTLTAPLLDGVQIRYTLDGSEPTVESALYEKPIAIDKTTTLHTAAYRGARRASLVTDAYYARLDPLPPSPDLCLDDLAFIKDPYGKSHPTLDACLWIPQIGKSYEGKMLRVRGKSYQKGLGFLAPSNIRYELKPEYDRFVALAGVDENHLDKQSGRNLVMHCNVVFRVFIDGKLMAESPAVRISQPPWRFNVKIPRGSRQISLAVMDQGAHYPLNLGNWVEAGFILKKD